MMIMHAKPWVQQHRTQGEWYDCLEADKTQKNPKKTKKKPLFLEKRLVFVSDEAYEMPTELHKPKYQ